jgi:hypothetical protein
MATQTVCTLGVASDVNAQAEQAYGNQIANGSTGVSMGASYTDANAYLCIDITYTASNVQVVKTFPVAALTDAQLNSAIDNQILILQNNGNATSISVGAHSTDANGYYTATITATVNGKF